MKKHSLKQKVKLQEKIKPEKILIRALSGLSLQIIEIGREHRRMTVAEASGQTNSNRDTIKNHLSTLVKQGHLIKHGAGRGKWYAAV